MGYLNKWWNETKRGEIAKTGQCPDGRVGE